MNGINQKTLSKFDSHSRKFDRNIYGCCYSVKHIDLYTSILAAILLYHIHIYVHRTLQHILFAFTINAFLEKTLLFSLNLGHSLTFVNDGGQVICVFVMETKRFCLFFVEHTPQHIETLNVC